MLVTWQKKTVLRLTVRPDRRGMPAGIDLKTLKSKCEDRARTKGELTAVIGRTKG
jgi:hypothetical protein